jgi:hypothetical protein
MGRIFWQFFRMAMVTGPKSFGGLPHSRTATPVTEGHPLGACSFADFRRRIQEQEDAGRWRLEHRAVAESRHERRVTALWPPVSADGSTACVTE